MKYTILRQETSQNREGQDETFIQIEIEDRDDIYTHAEWVKDAKDAAKVVNKAIKRRAMQNKQIEKIDYNLKDLSVEEAKMKAKKDAYDARQEEIRLRKVEYDRLRALGEESSPIVEGEFS